MGFKLVLVGLLFFLNPMISLIDVLPDFIGCGLILYGLNKLSAISSSIDESRKYFKWLLYVSIARALFVILSGQLDEIMILTLTMVFVLLEFGIICGALPLLLDGITYLNTRLDGKEKNTIEFKTLGVIFFGVRGFFSVLPQLGALSVDNQEHIDAFGEVIKNQFDFSPYSTILLFSNIILTLVAAGFWGWAIFKLLRPLITDKAFTARLKREYNARLESDPNFFTLRSLIFAVSILTASSFFLIDFIGDGVNFIPDFIFPALAIWAAYLLGKLTITSRRVSQSGAFYIIATFSCWLFCNIFMKEVYLLNSRVVFDSHMQKYLVSIMLAVVDAAALILFLSYLKEILVELVRRHTPLIVTDEYVRTRQTNDRNILVFNRLLLVWYLLGALTGISTVAFTATMNLFPIYWMVHFAINISFFVFTCVTMSKIMFRVRSRYQKPSDYD